MAKLNGSGTKHHFVLNFFKHHYLLRSLSTSQLAEIDEEILKIVFFLFIFSSLNFSIDEKISLVD